MADSELTKLRRARIRCHRSLKQTEALLTMYQDKLADIEARIYAISPEIQLPPRFRKRNPVFVRGEMTRMIMEVLRDADRPLLMREIVAEMFARKGVTALRRTDHDHVIKRVSCALSEMRKNGRIMMVSAMDKWRWKINNVPSV